MSASEKATELVKPEVTLDDTRLRDGRLDVEPNEPFTVPIRVRNTSIIMDAFEVTVLGIDDDRVEADPPLVALFPDTDERVELTITLPADFVAGPTELWVKVDSCTTPAASTRVPLLIAVAGTTDGDVTIDPKNAVGRRSGRFGVTVENTGNTPMNLMFVGDDDDNHFTFTFVPNRLLLEAGAKESVQAIVRGRRPFTGSAVPRPFSVTAQASGFKETASASLAQEPRVPRLALMLAAVFALFGLWALVVGAAIDKIIDDSDNDLASSFEDGVGAVVDGLDAESEQAAALDDAWANSLAARSAGVGGASGDGTSGNGVDLGADDPAGAGDATDGGSGADGSNGGDGSGGADATTTTAARSADGDPAPQIDAGAPGGANITTRALTAPRDSLVGSVVAGADHDVPIAGATVSVQALLETNGLRGRVDPNREPVVLATDGDGAFELNDMVPGLYAVTFSAPGYVDVVCSDVTIPVGEPRLASCRTFGFSIDPGPASQVGLIGAQASVAGIVTMAGDPFPGVAVTVSRLDTSTGQPVLAQRLDSTPATETDKGRFSFVFEPSAATPLTPGTFEIEVEADGFISERLVVRLDGGQHVVGLEVAIAPVPTTTTSTTTTTTLPPEVRRVFGTVTDIDTGQPIANATVQVAGAGRSLTLATLGDGSYEMQGLAVGLYNLSYSAPGYTSAARAITVPQTDAAAGSVALRRAVASITGTVTAQAPADADPAAIAQAAPGPLAGADVRDANGRLIAQTDANGVWTTSRSYAQGEQTFTVSAPGYLPGTVTADVAPPGQATATGVELVVRDSWVSAVGTQISPALLVPELECVSASPLPTFVPHTPSLAVTGVRWVPPGAAPAVPPSVSAVLQTTAAGVTQLVIGDVPRRGTLEIQIGGGPAGLYTSTITIGDLTAPPVALTLDFVGPGGLWAVVPDTEFGPSLRCPTLSTVGTPGVPIAAIGRSFYLRNAITDELIYLVDQLQFDTAVTATFGSGTTRSGTPTGPVPYGALA